LCLVVKRFTPFFDFCSWVSNQNHLFPFVSEPFCFGVCFEDEDDAAFVEDAAGTAGFVVAEDTVEVVDLAEDAVGVALVADEVVIALDVDATGVAFDVELVVAFVVDAAGAAGLLVVAAEVVVDFVVEEEEGVVDEVDFVEGALVEEVFDFVEETVTTGFFVDAVVVVTEVGEAGVTLAVTDETLDGEPSRFTPLS